MITDISLAKKNTSYVLVMDANAVDRFATCMLVQRFGYSIFTASTVEEALLLIRKSPPSAVVIDEGMITASFFSAFGKDQIAMLPPLIVLSPLSSSGRSGRRMDQDRIAYSLNKPINVEEFYRILQATIHKDARRNLRVETHLTAMLDDEVVGHEGYVTALSKEGLFFQGVSSLPKNTRIPVSFELDGRVILFEATVLYSHVQGEGAFKRSGMGLKFQNISPIDQDLIKTFIVDRVKEKTAPLNFFQ